MEFLPSYHFLTKAGRADMARSKERKGHLLEQQNTRGRLKPRERNELHQLQGITRREFLGKLSIGSVLTLAAGGGVAYLTRRDSSDEHAVAPLQTDTPEETEQQLQDTIERIEQGFSQWEGEVRRRVETMGGLPEGMPPGHFYAPFETVKINAMSSIRNRLTVERMHKGKERIELENPNHFSYDFLERTDHPLVVSTKPVAVFSPAERIQYLSGDIDPLHPVDFLVIYHETMHAVQDANVRAALKSPEEFEVYMQQMRIVPGRRPVLNVVNELDSYACELELCNVLCDGALRRGRATVASLSQKFRPQRPDQMKVIEVIVDLASTYYPQGIQKGAYPNSFVNAVIETYSRAGYEIQIPEESQRPQR